MSKTKRSLLTTTNENGGNGYHDQNLYTKNRFKSLVENDCPKDGEAVSREILHVVQAKSPNQKKYIQAINESTITVCMSQAACGKTAIAVGMAALYLSRGYVDRIIATRPLIPCDEEVGFLPGSLDDKVAPYLRPIFDELCQFFSEKQIRKFREGERPIIEVVPLGMIKGRTFNRSFIILDEAQDATYKQIKRFLTRLGHDSKVVITADPSQTDQVKDMGMTAIEQIVNKLDRVPEVSFVRLEKCDNMRHPILEQILERI